MSDQEHIRLSVEEVTRLFHAFGSQEEFYDFVHSLIFLLELFGDEEKFNVFLKNTGFADELKRIDEREYKFIRYKLVFLCYFFNIFCKFDKNLSQALNYWKQKTCTDEGLGV